MTIFSFICFFIFKNVSLSLSNHSTFDSSPFIYTVTPLSAPQLLTVEPLGVVLGGAQWWQAAQAAVDGRVSSREVHGCGCIKLPAGGDEGGGVVEWVVGTPSHPTYLIVNFGQICQLQHRERKWKVFNGKRKNKY